MPSHKRNGQTLFTMWLGDMERERWEKARKVRGDPSLAKFVKAIVNEHIAKDEVNIEQKARNGVLLSELKAQEKVIDERLASFQAEILKVSKSQTIPRAEIKSRVLALLETLKKPVEWENVVKVIGGEKQVVLDALEDLFKQKLITMTKKGEWILYE